MRGTDRILHDALNVTAVYYASGGGEVGYRAAGRWIGRVPGQELIMRDAARMLVQWVVDGMPTIRVDAGEALELALTDVPAVPVPDLPLPFEVYAVEVTGPGGSIPVDDAVDDNGPVPEDPASVTEAVLMARSHGPTGVGISAYHVSLSGHRVTALAMLEGQVDRNEARFAVNAGVLTSARGAPTPRPAYRTVRSTARNVPRIERPGPRVYVLTPEVEVPTPRHPAGEPGQLAHRGSPTVRTLVRGHWRNQAHGPAHQLRRLLWVRPFWRGPDGASISIRRIHVRSPGQTPTPPAGN